jgi:hypothetical protein
MEAPAGQLTLEVQQAGEKPPSAARAGWSPASDKFSTARSASSYPQTKHLILDLSGLSFMDSMGLGTFEFATVKIGESFYKVVPIEPFVPGEYCVSLHSLHSEFEHLYCFGIDPPRLATAYSLESHARPASTPSACTIPSSRLSRVHNRVDGVMSVDAI